MTGLDKPVRRRSRSPFAYYRKRIVPILESGDILAMRLERSPVIYQSPLEAVIQELALWHAQMEIWHKREERAKRRAT